MRSAAGIKKTHPVRLCLFSRLIFAFCLFTLTTPFYFGIIQSHAKMLSVDVCIKAEIQFLWQIW